MQGSRNKGKTMKTVSEDDNNKIKNFDEEKDLGYDSHPHENIYNFENDSSEDLSLDEEVEEKIKKIYDNKKNIFEERENENNNEKKLDKKTKQKYEKKVMNSQFNNYFDSYNNQIDDYYEVNYPGLNQYDFKIDNYSVLFKLIKKKKIFFSFLNDEDKEKDEKQNNINIGNMFSLMYDILFQGFNIFLYGFGNKMNFILDFISFYRDKYYTDSSVPLYVISFNLNNPEMNLKVILNKIQSCLKIEFDKYFGENNEQFSAELTFDGKIEKIEKIYNALRDRMVKKDDYAKEDKFETLGNDNNESDFMNSDGEDKEDKEEEDLEEKEKNEIKYYKDEDNICFPFKILLIIHNIGSPSGQNKAFNQHLSDLASKLYFLRLLVTCENLIIPYFWSLEVKDKYKFCYLKYHSYEPYDTEIDENNSIKTGNNIKEGYGLKEIFSSFTDAQKKLIKEIAVLNLKGDHEHLTPKGIVHYFVETGKGIVTDTQKLDDLIKEAIDHNIVELRVSNEINKEIYKMILERNVIEKIAEGEFM